MEIKERIKKVIDAVMPEGIKSDNSFAKSINMGQKTVNNYMNGTNKLSLKFVEKILQTFPQISSEWLMRGEGDMLRPQNSQEVNGGNNITVGGNASHVTNNDTSANERLFAMLEEKDRQLAEKDRQIAHLFDLLKEKSSFN